MKLHLLRNVFSMNISSFEYPFLNKSKEDLKLKVQEIFTKIRNTLNEKEDQLLLDIDNKYDNKNILKKI